MRGECDVHVLHEYRCACAASTHGLQPPASMQQPLSCCASRSEQVAKEIAESKFLGGDMEHTHLVKVLPLHTIGARSLR